MHHRHQKLHTTTTKRRHRSKQRDKHTRSMRKRQLTKRNTIRQTTQHEKYEDHYNTRTLLTNNGTKRHPTYKRSTKANILKPNAKPRDTTPNKKVVRRGNHYARLYDSLFSLTEVRGGFL